MGRRAVATISILAFFALAAAGCGGGGTSTVTVVHRHTVFIPRHKPVRKAVLAHRAYEGPKFEPGKRQPTALPCPERVGGRVKTIEIYSDVETCTRVAPRDRLLFVNHTGSGPEHVEPTPVALTVGGYEAFIGDGESAIFPAPVGSYLGIGLHETESHADAPAPRILVLPEGCAIRDPEPGEGLCYAAGAPPCPASALVIRDSGHAGLGAGSVYIHLEVVNRSRHACSVEGKPRVVALDAHGHPIGPPADRSGPTTTMTGNHARAVALGPGDAAIFELNYGEAANYSPPCGIRESKWVEVTLAPIGLTRRVPFQMQRCPVQGFSVGRLE
jgi:hypothetical protein